MKVNVIRNGVRYYCTTEEQLKLFLDAGYEVVKEDAEEESKPKAKKKSK